jgi:hypothetical protein
MYDVAMLKAWPTDRQDEQGRVWPGSVLGFGQELWCAAFGFIHTLLGLKPGVCVKPACE